MQCDDAMSKCHRLFYYWLNQWHWPKQQTMFGWSFTCKRKNALYCSVSDVGVVWANYYNNFFLLGCIGWLMPPGTFFCLCYGSSDIGINMQRCLHSHYRSGFAKPMFGLQSGVTYFTASPWHGCFRTARTSHKARQHLIAPTHKYPSSNLLHYLMSTLCSWVGPLSSSNSAFIFIWTTHL